MAESERINANTGKSERQQGDGKRVLLRTYGCQMNEYDSEIVAGILQSAGYVLVDDESDADIMLFNTCSVRQHAEEKVIGKIGQMHKHYRTRGAHPDLIIGVLGCMAQNYGDTLRQKIPCLDIICGPDQLETLPYLIEQALMGQGYQVAVTQTGSTGVSGVQRIRQHQMKAFVPIMRGCDNFCSYCIVPKVRGNERSRDPESILREIDELAAHGVKEVTLLGQNVNSYGKGLPVSVTFVDLLYYLNEKSAISRIRFLTSHPRDAREDMFDAMSACQKVCHHLHLPVQSGSARILSAMNRGYTCKEYLDKVHLLRKKIPRVGLTTDVIVGYPGETEEDFRATYHLLEECQYDSAFIFKYSVRYGTAASLTEDSVSLEVKKERNQILLALQDTISRAKNQALHGSIVDVLIDGQSKKDAQEFSGRADDHRMVIVKPCAAGCAIGDVVQVRVLESTATTLIGEQEPLS